MDRHIYRKRGALAFGVTVAVLVTAGCAVDALLSTQTKYWIADGAIPATVWVAVILASRIGVHVEPGGVCIVNILARHRLRWDEIERFDLAPAGRYPLAGRVVLKSGSGIPIEGITVPRFFTEQLKPNAQKPIDALNALLASARRPVSVSGGGRRSAVGHRGRAGIPPRCGEQRRARRLGLPGRF